MASNNVDDYANEDYGDEDYADENYADEDYADEHHADEDYAGEDYLDNNDANNHYANNDYTDDHYPDDHYADGTYVDDGTGHHGTADNGTTGNNTTVNRAVANDTLARSTTGNNVLPNHTIAIHPTGPISSLLPPNHTVNKVPTGNGATGNGTPGGGTTGHNAPIDPHYYPQSGPASSFAHFDDHICSFNDLWNTFQPIIQKANAGHGSADYAGMVKTAIQTVSASSGVQDYQLLCIIMQESTGNCFVQAGSSRLIMVVKSLGVDLTRTTIDNSRPRRSWDRWSYAVFWSANPQQSDIDSMVQAGATHFKQCLDQQKGNFYEALRVYNSGHIAESGDLSDPNSDGTPKYVQDVANRTHGWYAGNGAPMPPS
ncbi:uncharacterized protein Z519_10187 [Cladophialophora bantiana CBS 173.52]|uniref:Transglycosylase SLT domain-containing protein n=1 Tax=Cladophialophora bantiana (strain ATCC 10958 / CBS 173.52 / CDC B-1940 / NIH 8579) TaxID=1442370 RepID=A0A0D2H7P7_CLAB1|nr:uncharacterized protein Z519_10187 [Cladophialophora bantiana CBS 173.52]KIW89333.1 hypothetical protein Z519_10187 [Cladophialophora bantiana CBS 173.52]